MTRFLRHLLGIKPRWLGLHERPWRPTSYYVIALHMEQATRFSELAR